MSTIVLDGVSKVFEGGVQAVHDVDLTIASGEFMVLVGPSGCGKTTLLGRETAWQAMADDDAGRRGSAGG